MLNWFDNEIGKFLINVIDFYLIGSHSVSSDKTTITMNILPKKRWHVRTKDNIARVRRDEAAAQEEERKRQDKLGLAESEARINFLRRQSGLPEKTSEDASSSNKSSLEPAVVDLFADYKSHVKTTNKDLEKEKKEEQEKYEKQIGYLTYLGQDTNEALKVRSWYEVAPKRPEIGERNVTETNLKQKLSQDPLTLINALISSEKKPLVKRKRELTPTPAPETPPNNAKKHKKDKKHSKKHHKQKKSAKKKELVEISERHKREKLDRLRKERLRREAAERLRSEALFAPKESATGLASVANTPAPTPRIVQKYNSQFNPELAKQNMI